MTQRAAARRSNVLWPCRLDGHSPGHHFYSWLVFPFVMLYGTANGLVTIAKAAIPVELLGFEGAGAKLGAFSAPSLLTRAAAPFAFAIMTSAAGVIGTLVIMALIGAVSFGVFVQLTRASLQRRA